MYLLSYLAYILHSKNEYSLHSPFVFDFYMQVVKGVYKTKTEKLFYPIEILRKDIIRRSPSIRPEPMGAGSQALVLRSISLKRHAQYSSIPAKKGILLHRIISYYSYRNILEFGTNLGIGTSYMALLNKNAHVTTVEGVQDLHAEALKTFEKLQISNVTAVCSAFNALDLHQLPSKPPFDFIFLDGDHIYEATIANATRLLELLAPKGMLVIDDIRWSAGMYRAWNEIVDLPGITLSIDLGSLGICMVQTTLSKQNLMLRF